MSTVQVQPPPQVSAGRAKGNSSPLAAMLPLDPKAPAAPVSGTLVQEPTLVTTGDKWLPHPYGHIRQAALQDPNYEAWWGAPKTWDWAWQGPTHPEQAPAEEGWWRDPANADKEGTYMGPFNNKEKPSGSGCQAQKAPRQAVGCLGKGRGCPHPRL